MEGVIITSTSIRNNYMHLKKKQKQKKKAIITTSRCPSSEEISSYRNLMVTKWPHLMLLWESKTQYTVENI